MKKFLLTSAISLLFCNSAFARTTAYNCTTDTGKSIFAKVFLPDNYRQNSGVSALVVDGVSYIHSATISGNRDIVNVSVDTFRGNQYLFLHLHASGPSTYQIENGGIRRMYCQVSDASNDGL